MKPTGKLLTASFMAIALAGVPSASAAIYTLPGFTRTAAGASTTTTFDFVTNDGWSGTPPNTLTAAPANGGPIIYVTTTVSWAASSNIGTFQTRLNVNDDASAPRWGIGTDGSGFGFLTGNGTTDPDGAGPATAKPTVVAVNTTTSTSVTLVLKIDLSSPDPYPLLGANDYWYADSGRQSEAGGFMWINPNLGSTEASQFTPWAAWRSGNTSYSGVSFVSDTADADLIFSNIAIYTAGDTPFSVIPEPSTALLGALGLLALLRRRR